MTNLDERRKLQPQFSNKKIVLVVMHVANDFETVIEVLLKLLSHYDYLHH